MSLTEKTTAEKTTKHAEVKKGLKHERRFSHITGPFVGIEWTKRRAEVREPDGKIVFEMDNVRAPATWSQRAVDILASKYCRKAGVPEGPGATKTPEGSHESDAERVVYRLGSAIRDAGLHQGYFTSSDAQAFCDDLEWLLIHQVVAFNSPVWFNLGLAEAYGIRGQPAGCWEWSDALGDVQESSDAYTRPQISACYIQSVQDDLMDIAALPNGSAMKRSAGQPGILPNEIHQPRGTLKLLAPRKRGNSFLVSVQAFASARGALRPLPSWKPTAYTNAFISSGVRTTVLDLAGMASLSLRVYFSHIKA